MTRTWNQRILSLLAVAVLSLSVYSNTLGNGFAYDDGKTIVNNSLIKDLENIPKLFDRGYFALSGESTYRPAVTFTYFADYAVFGLNPLGFHLTNVLLHAVNGMLLYIFLTLITISPPASSQPSSEMPLFSDKPLLVSLIFAAHPVLAEAVNAVSYREDLLAFFFYMASLNLYLFLRSNTVPQTQSRLIYAASCILYLMALLSKEMAASLPLVVYCYEWAYCSKASNGWQHCFLNYRNMGYAVLTAAYLYPSLACLSGIAYVGPQHWGIMDRLATAPWIIAVYLKMIAYPVSLSADYVISPVSPLSVPFILSAALLFAVVIFAAAMRKRCRMLAFGTLFFVITLVPVLNIVPISNPIAERYLYLPIAGLIIAAGSALQLSVAQGRATAKPYLIAVFCIVLGAYSLGVVKRSRVWADDYSLWSDTVRKMPASSRAHNNIGAVYLKEGRVMPAVVEFESALKLRPDYPEALNNLGFAYYRWKKPEMALKSLLTALALRPVYSEARVTLGMIYYDMGRLDDALAQFRDVLRLDPTYPDLHNVYNNIGVVHERMGDIEDSLTEYQKASRLKPEDSRYRYNINRVYKKLESRNEAAAKIENPGKTR